MILGGHFKYSLLRNNKRKKEQKGFLLHLHVDFMTEDV